MSLNRRGFLKALLAGAAVTTVPKVVAATLVTETPHEVLISEKFETYAFSPTSGFFDTVCYKGDGITKSARRVLFAPTTVFVKCKTKASPWYVFRDNLDTLPIEVNEPGQEYIAYEFSKELEPIILPYINSEGFVTL